MARQGTAKELDEETGLYYYGARYLDPKYSMWISTDPALGEYIPQAPINDEAKKNNQNLPGMGGIFNHINSNLYHYAGNNSVRYVDPDGRILLGIIGKYNMSDYSDSYLGNSTSEKISSSGCYVTTFANVFYSSEYYGVPLSNSTKFNTPEKINNDKSLFAEDSACLNGRKESMNALFGEGNWDYWTKDVQGADGLESKLREYAKSDKAYMIVGIFDLSDDTACADNHMVGISELPDINGYFTKGLTATSNGDLNRYINIRDESAYNINNLKEIRVIFLE